MKKNHLRIALTLVSLSAVTMLAGCGKGASAGKLVMATSADFPPYEFYENQKIVGVDAEIAEAVAKKLGRELVIEDMKFDTVVAQVASGKADFAMAGLSVDPDRLKSVDFSDPYTTATQVIIVRKDQTDILTPEDLTGKKVGVQSGTTGDLYAENIENATVERYNSGVDAVMSLKQSKIDAVMIDSEPARVFVTQNDDLQIVSEPFTEEEYAIAVKKGNTDLLGQINTAIKELKESGELNKILNKYITAE